MIDRATQRPFETNRRPCLPPPAKQAVVTWLAVSPAITALLAALGWLGLLDGPLPVRTLGLTLILVPLMVFVLVPALSRIPAGWLCR